MQTIEIRNIGPLVETGNVPVSQVMLLIGEQSTGKSTFMKILCFCCWLEKQVMIGGAENGGYPPTQNGDIRSLFWLFSLMALQN